MNNNFEGTVISQFFGVDDYKDRLSDVVKINEREYKTLMYNNFGSDKVDSLVVSSLRQAEIVAEDWVVGVE